MNAPDPQRALEQYRRAAPGYDHHMRFADRVRAEAHQRLAPRPGDTVLDVACGTGLSFAAIQERIGPTGRLIGIEPSPDMIAQAREKVAQAGWQNVDLVDARAEEAEIPAQADAVLFFFTHDVLRSEPALNNVFAHVRPGARIVAAGGKWAPWWAPIVNAVVWWQARSYVTTFEGFDRPWSRLGLRVAELEVRPKVFGGAYLACGAAATPPRAEAPPSTA